MKKVGLIFLMLGVLRLLADDCATKGALTEALFILQNKQVDVQSAMAAMKKTVSECSDIESSLIECSPTECCLIKLDQKPTRAKNAVENVEEYHKELKALVFSGVINELETLCGYFTKYIDELMQDKPIKQQALKEMVDDAFLIKDKVDSEQRFFKFLCDIDVKAANLELQQKELQQLQRRLGKQVPKEEQQPKVDIKADRRNQITSLARSRNKLRQQLFKDKKELKSLKAKVAKINDELYKKKSDLQRFFIDRLTTFKP